MSVIIYCFVYAIALVIAWLRPDLLVWDTFAVGMLFPLLLAIPCVIYEIVWDD